MIKDRLSQFITIPYGSDAAPYEFIDPSPWLPAGLNSSYLAGDEYNGAGINWPRSVKLWTSSEVGSPTAMGNDNPTSGLPDEFGQTVDVRITRERRTIKLPRDHNRMRAAGYRGHVDED